MLQRDCHLIDLSCMSGARVSLTLGYLQAFSQTDDAVRTSFQFHRHVGFLAEPFEIVAERILEDLREIGGADVVGMTTFFWNRASNLKLAARIKQDYPHAVVVLGGNDVTGQGEAILAQHSDVDFVVHGEGEVTFRELLREIVSPSPDPSRVSGLSWRGADGIIHTSEPRARLVSLDDIPSPFQTGLFSPDEILETRTLVYEFSRGCPFKCAFCHWGAAVNTPTRRFSLARIAADLDIIIRYMPRGGTLFLADANFGMVQQDVDIARIMIELLQRYDKPIYFFANWSKNTTSRVIEAARVLFQGRMITSVTLSAQSLSTEALRIASRKNIRFEYYQELQKEFRSLGIPTYTELILGLPGEGYQSFIDGVERILIEGGNPVIYPLLLLNSTEFSLPEVRREHGLRTRWMPYQGFQEDAMAEVVCAHDQLSPDEWLRALCVRLVISVFYNALLKRVLTEVHSHYAIPFTTMCEWLWDHISTHGIRADALLHSLFENYAESWKDYHAYDPALVERVIGRGGIPDHVHYQAILRVVLGHRTTARALVQEMSDVVSVGLTDTGVALPGIWMDWVNEQHGIIEQIAKRAFHPDEGGFDTFVLAIYHGSVDTLTLARVQGGIAAD